MNFYPFNTGDYAGSTRHLSWFEDLAYRRMLDAYYIRELPLPLDRRALYRLVIASENSHREAVDIVLTEFFYETEEGWRHSRCDEEIAKARNKKTKAAQSANARWSNANHMPTQSERIADAAEESCERMANEELGNAPNPNPNPNPIEEGKKKEKALRAVSIGRPEEVDEAAWRDWRIARKGLAVTETAWAGMVREAGRAGISLQQAVRTCAERGWRGFRADWYGATNGGAPRNGTGQHANEPAWRTEQRERMAQAAPYAVRRPPPTIINAETTEIFDDLPRIPPAR